MTSHSPALALCDASADIAGTLRFVARQPILDARGRVHAYELLFRKDSAAAGFSGDSDLATRTMLDNAVVFGLEQLTGGLPAFVNCTADALLHDFVDVLPSGGTVLEILETLEPTPELIAACRDLKNRGFRLALDDFAWHPRFEPLLQLADYIKVDILATGSEERRRLCDSLRGRNITMLAEKVETQEQYRQVCDEGFTLFQGYYFCRPTVMKNRMLPANHQTHLELMRQLQSDMVDIKQLCKVVKRDTSLTYRLMRLVNSAAYAMQQEVRSVQSALMVIGQETFRRIAMLAIATEWATGRPSEILRMALVRGRFCEIAAPLCSLDPTEQYLLGMLSLLPAMLQVPMERVAPMLPVRAEIRESLEGAERAERILLTWIEGHERGDWPPCDALVCAAGLDQQQLFLRYAEAVQWAESALTSAA